MFAITIALTTTMMLGWSDPPGCLPADVNGDGSVQIEDLLAVLADWGPCPGCPSDINQDATVDIWDLLAVLGDFGATSDKPWFPREQEVTPQPSQAHLVTVDLDEDGDLDVLDLTDDLLHVHLNDGCGTFALSLSWPVAADGTLDSVQIADVDGDGDLDLLVTNFHGDAIQILTRTGLTIETVVSLYVGDGANRIAVADIDSDGDEDLAVTASNAARVMILVNSGEGDFAVVDDMNGGGDPASIVLTDVDTDGDADLLVGANSDVLVWFNDGQGGFGGVNIYQPGGMIDAVDLDQDGWVDLVMAPEGYLEVPTVRYGVGDGLFGEAIAYEGFSDWGLTVADLDDDGDLDFVMPHATDVLVNNGNRNFEWLRHSVPDSWTPRHPPTVADLDGDGTVDLVMRRRNGDFEILLGTHFDFANPRHVPYPRTGLGDFVLLDRDGDGDDEIIAVFSQRKVIFFEDDATGHLGAPVEIEYLSVPVASGGRAQLEAGDLDGDGDEDLLLGHGAVGVLLNSGGDFTFDHVVPGTQLRIAGLEIADFNGDGAPDFAVINRSSDLEISLFINSGTGTFELSEVVDLGIVDPPYRTPLMAADMQNDGVLDLVYALSNYPSTEGAIGVWVNPAEPPATIVVVQTNHGPGQVDVVDLDGDDTPEIVVASPQQSSMWRLTGYALVPVDLALSVGRGVVVADFDQNGQPDIVMGADRDAIQVYPNVNGSSFPLPRHYSSRFLYQLLAGDLNGDGLTDLVQRSSELIWVAPNSLSP